MPAHLSSSVQSARKAVASQLRELRTDAGLSGQALALRAGWYKSKVSRLENAVTPPSADDIRTWCRACAAEEQTTDLIAAARSADDMYVEWRRLQRTGLRQLQESYLPLYDRTRVFRTYCSNVVPGVLQTHAYATALLRSISAFHNTPDDVEAAVEARLSRSARVTRQGNHRLALLLEESVLRHQVGDAETMAGQLAYLLSAMAFPSISLGVIPFSAERRMWVIETFTVYDEEQAETELLAARVKVTAPTEVRQYLRAFAEFSRLAVHGAKARALITAAIDSIE
ncbi:MULTISPECIES: helix-turn-helix domain-containing protein [Streptomyces]|jgi:transcriptional regulator with XRE-family HTH domain|uniref:helix-turn-helix domain-containing protein n=1 Tax=Streptomyces TaxID=1883 RepID=UPI001902C75F|nr:MULTISPECIES: helix-turn-helix transcriptional regulator [unclassified Streptomyces]MCU4747157.1 helix-turn-helix transcriptional regulator [Streptomyces sp. G-5]QQN77806.1 helix-turn-helix domain-containing protein [Streptomyces sp. XC 2026]